VALGRDPERGQLGEGRDGRALASPVQLLLGREGCYKMGACRYGPPADKQSDDAAPIWPQFEDGGRLKQHQNSQREGQRQTF